MLADIAIAYVLVGIVQATFYIGLIKGYMGAGQSGAWGRLREFPGYVTNGTLLFYGCLIVLAWPFHRGPSPDTTRVGFGTKGTTES